MNFPSSVTEHDVDSYMGSVDTITDVNGTQYQADQLDESAFMTNGLGSFVHEADYADWLKKEIDRMDEGQLAQTMRTLFGWREMNRGDY